MPKSPATARRGYTISEMKEIVDYIKRVDAFGEIKGRKMWMDLEKTGLTTRTWQSMKEVFLKRIMLDLHNPYFKLSQEEIASFRVGYSMIKKNNVEKLPVTKSSPKKDVKTQSDKTAVTNGHSHHIDNTESDSDETVIINNDKAYKSAEEIKKDLLSDNEESAISNLKQPSSTKKFRDRISFAEPLTPILQEIFNDFGSDESSVDEAETVANNTNQNKNTINNDENISRKKTNIAKKKPAEVSDSKQNNSQKRKDSSGQNSARKNKSPQNKRKSNKNEKETVVNEKVKTKGIKKSRISGVINKSNEDDNNVLSAVSVDTQIPNNQEVLANHSELTSSQESIDIINKRKPLKKRQLEIETSDDEPSDEKKTKINNNEVSISSVDDIENVASTSKDIVSKHLVKTRTTRQSRVGDNIDIKRKAVVTIESHTNGKDSAADPLLQSVSVYSREEMVKTDGAKSTIADNMVLLGSSSENDEGILTKQQTTNSLRALFGYSNGGPDSRSRKNRTKSNRRKSFSLDSDSAESCCSTDKQSSRKYRNPGSFRILGSHKGGLYVTDNKRVYPVISDNRDGKYFMKYTSLDKEYGNEDYSYWKRKYVEERKRNASLTKTLDSEGHQSKRKKYSLGEHETLNISDDDYPYEDMSSKDNAVVTSKQPETQEKTVKLKFLKDGQEISLEGLWQNIQPILTDFMAMFDTKQPTPETTKSIEHVKSTETSEQKTQLDQAPKTTENSTKVSNEKINASASPQKSKPIEKKDSIVRTRKSNKANTSSNENVTADSKVRQKVEEMEKKIFDEIKEKHEKSSTNINRKSKTENIKLQNENTNKITVRRGRTKTVDGTENKIANIPVPLATRSNVSSSDLETKKSKSKAKQSKPVEKSPVRGETDEDLILYKFPSPEPTSEKNIKDDHPTVSPTVRTRSKNQEYCVKNLRKRAASCHSTLFDSDSLDSMQGYRDSDTSFININRQRRNVTIRRRHSVASMYHRNNVKRRKIRLEKMMMDSSSSNDMPVPQHSDSKDFRTESYDLLMQQRSSPRVVLNRIDENVDSQYETRQMPILNLSPAPQIIDQDDSFLDNKSLNDFSENKVESSKTSVTESPEISIVECITVSQESIDANMSKVAVNEVESQTTDILTCDILRDISRILNDGKNDDFLDNHKQRTVSRNSSRMSVDEIKTPKLNMKTSQTLEEANTSKALNERLSKMILDSAKKIEDSATDKTVTNNPIPKRSRKRSSTPNKMNKLDIDTVIEEHMEYCARNRGRNSCPPNFTNLSVAVDDTESDSSYSSTLYIDEDKIESEENNKREIIKVKIVRPSRKSKNKKCQSKDSSKTDMESGVFIHDMNDSVEFIHNHSEECLRKSECVSDKMTFSNENIRKCKSLVPAECTMETRNASNVTIECFTTDAQDVSLFSKTTKSSSRMDPLSPSSPFVSPKNETLSNSFNSLITEDLSDESPTKNTWFLVDEDELSSPQKAANKPKNPEYMNKIFPVAISVPNLSTITENSRNTDENTNVALNSDTKSCQT